jgi:polyprenyl-phospho-N-acetylgalactosaminyl synthase
LKTGIDYALSKGANYLVTFDTDGQHLVSDIPRLLEALDRERADFALGSRFLNPSRDMPLMRRTLLLAATVFTTATTGLRLTDTHNGLRAFTRRGALALRLRQDRMAHASEILAEIARSGLRYVEVPVTIAYTDYSLAKGQRASPGSLTFIQFHRRAPDGCYPGLFLPCVTELPRAHPQDAFAEDWRSDSDSWYRDVPIVP